MVTLFDVIEHLPKKDGVQALKNMIGAGANLIMVFTPDGFMPQHAEEKDAWGFDSGSQQEHLSGWTRDDFDDLGFTSYMTVKNLHIENGEKWDGLLAIRDTRPNSKPRIALWDPCEYPNAPPEGVGVVVVLGRHSRLSGSVVGTHKVLNAKKIYIPALSFAPDCVQQFYKVAVIKLIRLLSK